jgi:hypothetical protein
MPLGPPGRQVLTLVTRSNDHYEELALDPVSFVPLVRGR